VGAARGSESELRSDAVSSSLHCDWWFFGISNAFNLDKRRKTERALESAPSCCR